MSIHFAAYLAERFDCTHVIAIGRPSAKDLIHLYPKFEIIGIVPSADLRFYRNRYRFVVQSIKKWTDQGISVHILENWSTDPTYDLAKDLESRLPVTVERFPKDGPSRYFDWGAMLARMEALSREIEADAG